MGTRYILGTKIGYLVQIRTPDLHIIHNISNCLKGQWRRTFEKMHGNLLQILEIATQPEALEALVQYYDAPARCFTFRDFQMAPTLEEYERLLGLPLTESGSYFHRDQTPSWGTIARLLKVSEEEITRGLPRKMTGPFPNRGKLACIHGRSKVVDIWDPIVSPIRGLCGPRSYGGILGKEKQRGKSHHGSPGRHILFPPSVRRTEARDLERLHSPSVSLVDLPPLPMQTSHHLPNRRFQMELDSAHDEGGMGSQAREAYEKSICWYPPWNEREHIIIKCEGYPNVPLLGTQGAINYNPELAVRQAGYPIIVPPPEEAMTPFVLRGPEVREGSPPSKNSACGASPEYRQWVAEHVKTVRLPWNKIQPRDSSTQQYEVQETLEVERLKEALEEIHQEKHLNNEITKKARVEHDARLRIGSCLKAADKEMCARRAERDQVTIEKERLERALLDSQRREDEQREQFCQLQEKMRLLEEELARANLSKELLKEQGRKSLLELVRTHTKAEEDEAQLKDTIWGLNQVAEGWKRRCQDIADSTKEQVNVVTAEAASWKDKFLKLASLANLALKDIPRGLQAAEGMADFMKLPREITGFLGLCRGLYGQIKARVAPP
ncbi:hypothetical protein CR513_04427, partial [Mucuna pruriens]